MASNSESRYLKSLTKSSKHAHSQREATLKSWGWTPWWNSEDLAIGGEHGYFACAYYKLHHETQTAELVIAHRGTCFNEAGNVLADLAIAEGAEPAILREAAFEYMTRLLGGRDFYNPNQNVIPFSLYDYRISKITHTGFSLGGFIAGACVGLSKNKMLEAVTFDAPGIGALKLPMEESRVAPRIVNYVTTPNLVNTCNRHVGEIREIVMVLSRPSHQEVKFEVNPADLGFGTPKQFSNNDSDTQFTSLIKENRLQRKKQESTTAAFQELNVTLNSHNLEKVISAIEQEFLYNSVYRWPEARNKMIYGKKPKTPNNFTSFGFDNVGSSIFSLIAIILQGAKQVGSSVIWDLTKKLEGEREVGVIGIRHSRKNIVYYSQEEYLESLVQDIPEIPMQPNQNLEGDNIIPLGWLQSARSRQSSERTGADQNTVVPIQVRRTVRR